MGPGETRVKAYEVSVARGDTLRGRPAGGGGRPGARPPRAPPAASPGPYVAETFPVYVEEDYVVVEV